MANEENIEKIEEPTENEDTLDREETVTTCISNLAQAFSYLCEIDSQLLSKGRQAKLARMKRKIFDAIDIYCDYMPQDAQQDET